MKFRMEKRNGKDLFYHENILMLAAFGLLLFEVVGASEGFDNTGITSEDLSPLQIASGKIIGTKDTLTSLNSKKVKTYLGIPYAKPPTGKLRFKAPQPADKWDEMSVKSLPNSCPQVIQPIPGFDVLTIKKISEDCLYLNVFVPEEETSEKAVMVWIHGGGFQRGSSTLDIYDGRHLAAITGTIIVSINYRLGAFGFLNIEGADKNVGMLDQVMALRWVQDNIFFFGGDHFKVTLFGESAGAASVGMHLLSPLSKDYFHQAILQSGSPINPWSYVSAEESQRRSQRLTKKVKCSKKSNVFKCMQRKKMDDILSVQENIIQAHVQFAFVPTIDGEFLNVDPELQLRNRNFEPVPILFGSNKDEGTFFLAFSDYIDETKLSDSSSLLKAFFELFHTYPKFPAQLDQGTIISIENQYSPKDVAESTYEAKFTSLNRAVTDSSFICPLNNFIDQYASSHAYSYYYTQSLTHSPPALGVTHASEIFYTFSYIVKLGLNSGFTQEEINFSIKLSQMWGSFAKTGDPNETGDESPISYPNWPKYSPDTGEYLELNANNANKQNIEPSKQLCKVFCDVWKTRISSIQDLE